MGLLFRTTGRTYRDNIDAYSDLDQRYEVVVAVLSGHSVGVSLRVV